MIATLTPDPKKNTLVRPGGAPLCQILQLVEKLKSENNGRRI
jgi:hypothetical protein